MSDLVVSEEKNKPALKSFTDLDPMVQVEQASKIATVLSDVIEQQKLYAVISGKKYAVIEAWQTMGTFLGILPVEKEVKRIDDNIWEAKVDLVNRSGIVVGTATHICGGNTEPAWAKRPDFARRSMAVTRATGKAYRTAFSWIMSMAGYEATPREEMDHVSPVMYEATNEQKIKLAAMAKEVGITEKEDLMKLSEMCLGLPVTGLGEKVSAYKELNL